MDCLSKLCNKQKLIPYRVIIFVFALFCYSIGKAQFTISDTENYQKAKDYFNNNIQNDPKKSIEYGHALEKYAIRHQLQDELPEIFNKIGLGYYYIGDYDVALDYATKAQLSAQLTNNKLNSAKAFNTIGIIYGNLRNVSSALIAFKKSMSMFHSIGEVAKASTISSNIGTLYNSIGQLDSALVYVDLAINNFQKIQHDSIAMTTAMLTKSAILSRKGEGSKSIQIANDALRISKIIKDPRLDIEVQISLAELFYDSKNYPQAIEYASKVVTEAHKVHAAEQLKFGYKCLSDSYEKVGQKEKALFFLKKYIIYNDSTLNRDLVSSMEQIQSRFEVKGRQQQIDMLEKDKKILQVQEGITSQRVYYLIILIVLIIVISLLILYNQQQRILRKRAEQELSGERLSYVEKEMSNLVLLIVQKNELISTVKQELKNIRKTAPESELIQNKTTSLIHVLNNNFGIEKDKALLNSNLDQIHNSFLNSLEKKYPNITESEKKIVSLLRLNFTSKEMASVLGISHNSVNVARYRLRKKLGLEHDVDLQKIIKEI